MEDLRTRLDRKTEAVRTAIADWDTRSLVAMLSAETCQRINDRKFEERLTSPAKQYSLLMSIVLSTSTPAKPCSPSPESWHKVIELLNALFMEYAWTYWPEPDTTPNDDWKRTREVAMVAFLHYFQSGLIASTDQVVERIRTYIVPFDSELLETVGLSATQALGIADSIHAQVEEANRAIKTAMNELDTVRLSLVHDAEQLVWDDETFGAAARQRGGPLARAANDACRRLYVVDLSTLSKDLAGADRFFDLFSATREERQGDIYITDELHFEKTPLIKLSHSERAFVSTHHVYVALLNLFEKVLVDGPHQKRFLRSRDRKLEQETTAQFRRLLPNGRFFCNVYETPANVHEHDIVCVADRVAIVIEAKATPPRAPFRDPEKAYERIERSFASDRGPQKAYEQCLRLWEKWNGGEPVPLYDSKGQLVCDLCRESIDELVMVCVTRDDYGSLTTDLSLLLQKPDDAPYPWAVNAFALGFLADGWLYAGYDGPKLLDFLRQRVRLHGKIFASDELEVAGFFIKHGSLAPLDGASADKVVLHPSYSSIFDEIYIASQGGPKPDFTVTEPVEVDAREAIGKMFAERERHAAFRRVIGGIRSPSARGARQGRNEKCACGSGRKHKKCCGA